MHKRCIPLGSNWILLSSFLLDILLNDIIVHQVEYHLHQLNNALYIVKFRRHMEYVYL